MEKYIELGKEAARLAPDFVREMSERIFVLYQIALEDGSTIVCPPLERLQQDSLGSWLNRGHFAYLAFDNSFLAGVTLLAVEKPSSQITIIESWGPLIRPIYQHRDFAKNIASMIEEKCQDYSGGALPNIGTNYFSHLKLEMFK